MNTRQKEEWIEEHLLTNLPTCLDRAAIAELIVTSISDNYYGIENDDVFKVFEITIGE